MIIDVTLEGHELLKQHVASAPRSRPNRDPPLQKARPVASVPGLAGQRNDTTELRLIQLWPEIPLIGTSKSAHL